jgi:hypothetical protein
VGRHDICAEAHLSELIDNRAHRVRQLKDIISRLHDGEPADAVKSSVAALVGTCDAAEVAAMEQELMADGMPATEIMRMCDLHAQVLRDVMVERPRTLPPGHPVDTFRRENDALQAACAKLRALAALATTGVADDQPVEPARHDAVRAAYNTLMDVEKHYQRKENLLFPFLEHHGITGPSKVMWGKDDEVRRLLKDVGDAIAERHVTVGEWKLLVDVLLMPALAAVEEMVLKEEKVLLPLSLETLTDADWGEIWAQSPAIGWCLVDPRDGWRPPATVHTVPDAGAITMATGTLTLEQLTAIFSVLPVDLTFVDADDRVRFFTEGRDRVFQRPRAIIGRQVQHCHPPASVDIVERILSDFRAGRQDVASFWINFRGRFVHIRYFAVRDEARRYMGTLEVTQDLTQERALEGERRLLHYD